MVIHLIELWIASAPSSSNFPEWPSHIYRLKNHHTWIIWTLYVRFLRHELSSLSRACSPEIPEARFSFSNQTGNHRQLMYLLGNSPDIKRGMRKKGRK